MMDWAGVHCSMWPLLLRSVDSVEIEFNQAFLFVRVCESHDVRASCGYRQWFGVGVVGMQRRTAVWVVNIVAKCALTVALRLQAL